MKTALIALSEAGARLLAPLAVALPEARMFVHESVETPAFGSEDLRHGPDGRESDGNDAHRSKAGQGRPKGGASALSEDLPVGSPEGSANPTGTVQHASTLRHPDWNKWEPSGTDGQDAAGDTPGATEVERFTRIAALTKTLFPVCEGLIYAAPCGVVVRSIAPLVKSKRADPAVVVLDAGGRWAVSLLSGHEGGANALAIRVANIIGAEPVVTTTTEALKSVIVGIGCRRGTKTERIVAAIQSAVAEAGVTLDEVRLLASADIKADEPGLLEASEALDIPIRFIPAVEIRASSREFTHSDYVQKKVNLPAVAEPAALLAGRRTQFICRKKTYNGITVAIARENFSWSGSDPEGR